MVFLSKKSKETKMTEQDIDRRAVTLHGYTIEVMESGIRFDAGISQQMLGLELGDTLVCNVTDNGIELRVVDDDYKLMYKNEEHY
jgi:hypothetical protein